MTKNNKNKGNIFWRWIRNILIGLLLIIVVLVIVFNVKTKITPPDIVDTEILNSVRENPAPDFYKIGNNWLRKNKYGLWEMYLEGSPFEIGVINGKLTKELIKVQEDAFVEQINTLIPSKSYLRFLKYFIAWFNRDIDEYIPKEYIDEIYGVSFGASEGYDYIGNNYERMLNYHGAHDIGHALQSLALVGCTSFAANMNSEDSSLILGRNFDFYINESFAKNKIIAFVKPDNGHEFVYITWASMIGVVSGMNKAGLTVTINAAKSDIPTKAKMPISLLAREILQYAGNIEEAIAIAKKRETFVSESILVGSAPDHKAIIIEKSPSKIDTYSTVENKLVCSNHFQSATFEDDPNNLQYISESASSYRQSRCQQLIDNKKVEYISAAEILRDYNGIDNTDLGIGNEKAMAQFISHHSVIFQPEKLNLWVSTSSYQFGEYLMYNEKNVFDHAHKIEANSILYDSTMTIPSHTIIRSKEYSDLMDFRRMREIIKTSTSEKSTIEDEFIEDFIAKNPNYYHGYVVSGNYYYEHNNSEKALLYYNQSLSKEFENTTTRTKIESRIEELESKLK